MINDDPHYGYHSALCDYITGEDDGECDCQNYHRHFVKLQRRCRELFDAIRHGDQKHQDWLNQAIKDHFEGREVKRESDV